jgi:hypothetical protein
VRTVAELVGLHIDFVDGVVILSETPIPERPATQPQPTPAPQTGGITLGAWNGNVFTNEQLGLRITVPNSWHIESRETLFAYAAIGMDAMGVQVTDELWSLIDTNILYDMMASSPTGASINIIYERILPGHGVTTAQQYIDASVQTMEMIGMDIDARALGTVQIGNREWLATDIFLEVEGLSFGVRQLVNLQNGFATIISLGVIDGSETLEQLNGFLSGI